MTTTESATEMESIESFRERARQWLADNIPRGDSSLGGLMIFANEEDELAYITEMRALQRQYYEGGFAGICFPKEYGGQGLSPAHQLAFNEEVVGYRFPAILQVPTFVPCGAVLLEFGTEEQKKQHLPAMMRGDEIWMQFLSEPSGGSDVAGALTTAVRDGDEWVVNGSKIWTTGAWFSDYGLALVRTNWDVPKHRGLSVFIIEIDQPDIELHRIEMINGSREFCQEFLTDVRVPDSDRVGEVDDGWTVGTRWMFHERASVGGGSPYVSGPRMRISDGGRRDQLVEVARATGRLDDSRTLDLIGEARMLGRAGAELSRRIGEGMAARVFPDTTAAIARLMSSVVGVRVNSISLELAGSGAAAAADDDPWRGAGMQFMMRQTACIGGGTTEMARNNIAERVLGMPREVTHDRNMPFRDVPKGPPGN
ncbi:MAG TPA: acyl-CoA dehydrogenase family protein [Acidimicrobiia bacterium]|nr:acyl-CoA dehydrogenase family protein [Acidimicrobiia bacterium]